MLKPVDGTDGYRRYYRSDGGVRFIVCCARHAPPRTAFKGSPAGLETRDRRIASVGDHSARVTTLIGAIARPAPQAGGLPPAASLRGIRHHTGTGHAPGLQGATSMSSTGEPAATLRADMRRCTRCSRWFAAGCQLPTAIASAMLRWRPRAGPRHPRAAARRKWRRARCGRIPRPRR